MDTCGQDGSIALVDTLAGEPVVEAVTLPGRAASERLMPELRRMLASQGWGARDLAVVGVVSGPGSFTGVRAGLAAAKGLCEATGSGLVTVSRLDDLARKGAGLESGRFALLEAGRGEFFFGRYGPGESPVEALLSREAVLDEVASGGVAVACEESVRAAFPELEIVMVGDLRAADALPLVLERVERGEFSDVGSSDANYLRRTEQETLERLKLRASRV